MVEITEFHSLHLVRIFIVSIRKPLNAETAKIAEGTGNPGTNLIFLCVLGDPGV